jgi:hypothetical protein
MVMRNYTSVQFGVGGSFEQVLDAHFGARFDIALADRHEQRMGIDRFFTNCRGSQFSVEYKTEIKGGTTGNFFVELEIVYPDGKRKPGWVRKQGAQFVILYIPAFHKLHWLRYSDLRRMAPTWEAKYGRRPGGRNIDSQGKFMFHAEGVLVPFRDLPIIRTEAVDGNE